MNSKYITDELIAQRMEDKGWIEDSNEDHMRQQVLEHYECEITENWQNPDFTIYEESTADGYNVWIATDDDGNINVSEDVYYYENDLEDVLFDAIPDYANIYCDNYDIVDCAIIRHYEDLMYKMEDEIIDELLDEGYNHRVVDPINALQYIEMISQDFQFDKDNENYCGFINITIEPDYKWLNYATLVRKDRSRYEIVANHYGLTIAPTLSSEELIFNEFKGKDNE